MTNNQNNDLIYPLTQKSNTSLSFYVLILITSLVFGIVSGFILNKIKSVSDSSVPKAGKIIGIQDKKTLKDSATGTLKTGGVDGEGNFHLERPGGNSQNVYLTSTVVDLSTYVGKKVRVWGETFKGEKAGWLMDVGAVEILQ